MNITGKLTVKNEPTIVGRDLNKQQIVVVSTDGNQLCIDFLGENIDKLTDIPQGADVSVDFSTAINIANNGAIFNRVSGKSITVLTTE